MTAQFPHGYALIIGAGGDLPTTVNDAAAIHKLLCDPARCAYDPQHVQLLAERTAGRAQVLHGLEQLAAQANADPDATAIVYFSGHGMRLPEPHVMPFGYDTNDLAHTAIAGDLLNEKLRTIHARKLIVLLDCCHAGSQATAKAPRSHLPIPAGALAELERSSGRVVIASSRQDELSYIFKEPYSAFTQALLEGLAGYGAFERDGYCRILDLALYVGRVVPNRSRDKQHPVVKVSNLEDNFALAYYAAGEAQPKQLEGLSLLPDMLPDANTPQIATWKRMLANKRGNLLLIEERMSEYVSYQDIPLQLIKNQSQTQAEIADLERKLGI